MNDQAVLELLAWTRVMAAAPLRQFLQLHLHNEKDWLAFEATDGSRNRETVGKISGYSGRAIGDKWKAWRAAGLVIDLSQYDYPRHIANPESVGLARSDVSG